MKKLHISADSSKYIRQTETFSYSKHYNILFLSESFIAVWTEYASFQNKNFISVSKNKQNSTLSHSKRNRIVQNNEIIVCERERERYGYLPQSNRIDSLIFSAVVTPDQYTVVSFAHTHFTLDENQTLWIREIFLNYFIFKVLVWFHSDIDQDFDQCFIEKILN